MAETIIWSAENPTALDKTMLETGVYVFRFDTRYVPDAIIPGDIPRELKMYGKEARITGYQLIRENGEIVQVVVTLHVIKNLWPLIAVIAALGVIATFFLQSVARVTESIGGGGGIVLVAVLVLMFLRYSNMRRGP